ncbi:hypothetical protein [Streptomyces sp. NPDC001815]|uniref:hypothetical protein n=1 Tax=Streptomyces sp. NPDC001815 TaxID=3154526 RepID=UPI00331A62FF
MSTDEEKPRSMAPWHLHLARTQAAMEKVSGPPGTGTSPYLNRLLGAHLARGDRLFIMSTGGGKTHAALMALSLWVDAGKSVHAFQEALTRRPAVSSMALLSSSEADNKLPAITSSVVLGDTGSDTDSPGADTVDVIESLCLLLKEIEHSIQELCRVLEVLLDLRHFEAPDPAPSLATSPCGVIRFAAPMVPRAPGCGQPVSLTADHYALTA